MNKSSLISSPNYSFEAELAAREAEINRREAAVKRAELEAVPVRHAQVEIADVQVDDHPIDEDVHRADEFVDARLAELAEREDELAARENLIRLLEANLDQSRQRLEERLKQFEKEKAKQAPAGSRSTFRVEPVEARYFSPGSYTHEGDWWTNQLGKRPHVAA